MQEFLDLCSKVGMPINMSKTHWASQLIVFLGILLNDINFTISVPEEKRARVLQLLNILVEKHTSKVKQLQILCGYLNFLCKAIFPGRAFVCCMCAKYSLQQKVAEPKDSAVTKFICK